MMVGGVSESGELPRETASRELGEELGLVDEGNLSKRLFQCGVATGYNRCIVSFYAYEFGEGETVKHQEEEICWGGWVDRSIVMKGAKAAEDKEVVEVFNGMLDDVVDRVEWVPDGLVVWEKFQRYEENNRT
ncbi:hypothetical protein TrCOL_g9902 [Triparma columacea]|uniref:Nudix hydrolase domain-containing protein n=1 Tax=Triparma columacea TaxID=722753 RepID=A0A9W7G250_9STRA|nr:hypothetical protein TrCOL_g9902 [Triparma columacea]